MQKKNNGYFNKNGIEIKIAFVQKTEKYFINNKELEKNFMNLKRIL